MKETLIELHSVSKIYGDRKAVDELNLKIFQGEIFGLLGPNGAGKSTTMLMILGLTEASAGNIYVNGLSPYHSAIAVKREIGYLADAVGFYDHMTAHENLAFFASLNQIPRPQVGERVDQLLKLVGLSSVSHKKPSTFSRGMKQRLGIAQALVKRPKILILDEPTLGLDPSGVEELLQLVRDLNALFGITIIISSHQLDQVQKVCHRVGLFVEGKMEAVGSIADLSHQLISKLGHQSSIWWHGEFNRGKSVLTESIIAQWPSATLSWTDQSVKISTPQFSTPQLVKLCVEHGMSIKQVQSNDLTLEEIYGKYFTPEKNEPKSSGV
ncbi:ATP-binding cassette domain-containing protein [Sphingobacterium sp. DK4209]|uniref:ATP-binding cassette domain-containing protein n=1 Tax=Sphingobacterium zhuxiongii TaxID=2662364 RepID=A0A5Q0QIS7_9SPHI|nr:MULTISPECIES: ABC transporter ATP-binding protein [unclassified Sphingobacterium]MVZ66483.1 ATP-binding cassette domain-containing protein [Sphingobacterium sp. DK4209]QGA27862.1 ATP-binding cassette domain-containing protein [Sphingobacterium sp. dk4302]